jgi:hypothetical protein
MHLVEIDVQCSEQHSEILAHEGKDAEFLLEELVVHLFREFYEHSLVDEVTINRSARSTPEQLWYDIRILVRCSHPLRAMDKHGREFMELALEGQFSSALTEFFDIVEVKLVMITTLSADRVVI